MWYDSSKKVHNVALIRKSQCVHTSTYFFFHEYIKEMVVICSSFLSLSWLSSKMVSFFIPSRWSEWCDLCLPKKWIVFTTACRLCMCVCVCCVLYVYILYSRPPKMCGSYPNSGPLFHPVQLNQISFTWWCLSVMRPFCSLY